MSDEVGSVYSTVVGLWLFLRSVKLYLLVAFFVSLARRMTTGQIYIIYRNLDTDHIPLGEEYTQV